MQYSNSLVNFFLFTQMCNYVYTGRNTRTPHLVCRKVHLSFQDGHHHQNHINYILYSCSFNKTEYIHLWICLGVAVLRDFNMILFDNCLQIYKLTRKKIINNMLQMTFNFFSVFMFKLHFGWISGLLYCIDSTLEQF